MKYIYHTKMTIKVGFFCFFLDFADHFVEAYVTLVISLCSLLTYLLGYI